MITYFIMAGGAVKIGQASNISNRIRTIQTCCPMRITLLKTSNIKEAKAHKIAATISERMHGEWFQASVELLSWISGIEQSKRKGSAVASRRKKGYSPQSFDFFQ
jgi:hypothetical protein